MFSVTLGGTPKEAPLAERDRSGAWPRFLQACVPSLPVARTRLRAQRIVGFRKPRLFIAASSLYRLSAEGRAPVKAARFLRVAPCSSAPCGGRRPAFDRRAS